MKLTPRRTSSLVRHGTKVPGDEIEVLLKYQRVPEKSPCVYLSTWEPHSDSARETLLGKWVADASRHKIAAGGQRIIKSPTAPATSPGGQASTTAGAVGLIAVWTVLFLYGAFKFAKGRSQASRLFLGDGSESAVENGLRKRPVHG